MGAADTPDEPGTTTAPGLPHRVALGLAICRVGLGLMAIVEPSPISRPWIGASRDEVGPRVLARALGGRDVALGLGVLLAARRNAPLRGWVEAGALADAVDAAATALAFRRLPRSGRYLVLAASGGAAALGSAAARRL